MRYHIYRQISSLNQTQFMSSPDDKLQVGLICKDIEDIVEKHRHNDVERKTIGTSEVLYCLRTGKCTIVKVNMLRL